MTETTAHHEVRGSGPVLLVIPGGAGHPMGLDGLVERLAGRFTVVTYDPMGLAHGRLGEPVEDQRVEAWSDGARQVLDSLLPGGESAYVFGSSSGGIAALDLLTSHPDRVRHAVAHEPPGVTVLPDAAQHRKMFEDVYETYRAAGLQAASVRLNAGLEDRMWEAPPPPPVGTSHIASPPPVPDKPMAVFIAHVLRQFTAYEPDFATLHPLAARLTLAGGHESRTQLPHRAARMLAQRSGSDFVEFPGGHIGAVTHPVEFAERLAERLLPVPSQVSR
ncbi:alpha/beta hydrolase [Streptomyces vastus]|uniref:Alpha/beta hydrolase n=1 Tax=Streptomyces vastus TaxID=285451 RepID=A0ABN3RB24_9ACTN